MQRNYKEGLRLFMKNEGFKTESEAIKAIEKDLEGIKKSLILKPRKKDSNLDLWKS